jgi:hypothetical protein
LTIQHTSHIDLLPGRVALHRPTIRAARRSLTAAISAEAVSPGNRCAEAKADAGLEGTSELLIRAGERGSRLIAEK